MKLFGFVAVCVTTNFIFLQTCFATRNTFSEADIQQIRAGLEALPGMQTKSIENMVNTLKMYRNNPVIFFPFYNNFF